MIASHETELMQSMSESQRMLFSTRMAGARKARSTALLLTFFLGGLGAHRFYLGQPGLGILYAVFVWTLIPTLISLVELFMVGGRVDRYNDSQADIIAQEMRLLKSPAMTT
jgi:TM2 domain-containing membrane protein YozV